MAKQPNTSKYVSPTNSAEPVTARKATVETPVTFPFEKQNYLIFGVGVLMIVVGFFLMSGGAMPDANTWDESIIYSFRRITLAPLIVIAGFGVVVFGIFKK